MNVPRAGLPKSATSVLVHVFYWLLAVIASLWLWIASLDFAFVLAGKPPERADVDTNGLAASGMIIVIGPFWAAACLAALALFVWLWSRAPELRIRALVWAALMIAASVAGYDHHHPSSAWMVQGSAAFVFAVAATLLPPAWSLLRLWPRRRSDARAVSQR